MARSSPCTPVSFSRSALIRRASLSAPKGRSPGTSRSRAAATGDSPPALRSQLAVLSLPRPASSRAAKASIDRSGRRSSVSRADPSAAIASRRAADSV